jgi:hypothetical protein
VEQDRYVLTYRAAEARQVMRWIEVGQSGCLVGLRGAGKSNLLRFLLHEDVQRHYLGRHYVDIVFVLVDLLALTERTEWAVYELILDRLMNQLRLLGIEEIVEVVTSFHQDATHSRDPLAARRAFERCVDVLCQRSAQRVVLFLDEFDAVFRTLDTFLLRCLRAVRDAHKGQVSYVIVTDDLVRLRDDLAEAEHFYRLVSRNVCGLGPYSEADARQMICRLASRRSVELNEGDMAHLIELSGGHAGLLKATLSLLWGAYQESSLTELIPTLSSEPAVQAECQKVWESLSQDEQAALCTLTDGVPVDPHTLRRMTRKGLIREGISGTLVFSPLFADFVHRQLPSSMKGTLISRAPPVVRVGGQRVESLTPLEFEMLCYLYEHRGQVCTKDALIENVYRQQYSRMRGGVTDEALQTLISRLRDKIEPDRRRPRYVVTVRGEGYKFVEPDEPLAS